MTFAQTFQKQIQTLLEKGYPQAAGVTEEEFLSQVKPLQDVLLSDSEFELDQQNGKLSFVIVIKNELVSSETTMSLTELQGKNGITKLFPHTTKDFQSIPTESIPDKKCYLLLNIDRGKASINLPPRQALKIIRQAHRLPLTIDEGIALITHYPDFLQKNNCFSLLASRHPGDQRVPAIWINSHKQPNLGWCWDGNPHTWLGSASAERRTS